MNTCSNCGKVAGGQSNILQGCVCQYSMQAPPQRTWVSLTLEKIWQIATDCTIGGDLHADKFARAIESRLKELNT